MVSLVKTYENGELIEEIILSKTTLLEPVSKILEVGTSEFLAEHNIHIGDSLYLGEATDLLSEPDLEASSTVNIAQYLDVTLLELINEDMCKISFNNIEGYVATSALTSVSKTPDIVEKSRIQKILLSLNTNMSINQVSGLTEDDFKNVLSNLSEDTLGIVEGNYKLFYNLEQTYNINGLVLASIFIYDTSWGTDLNGLLDNNYSFNGWIDVEDSDDEYVLHNITTSNLEEYLDTLCKILVLEYVYPLGVNVFNSEYSTGIFYVGPSIHDLGVNYNNTNTWSTGVYTILSQLYGNL